MKKYIIIFVLLLYFVPPTKAYLVFGNYDGVNVDGSIGVDYIVNSGTRWLSDFYWGGGDILIDSIEIYAQMEAGSSDNIHMYIYGNNGLVGALEPDENIGTAGNYMFSPTTTMTLSAGNYDLVIEPGFVAGTGMSWYRSLNDSGGAHSEASGTTWGTWEYVSGSPTYRVYGTVVPEPSTIALFLLGFSCVVARRKRKN